MLDLASGTGDLCVDLAAAGLPAGLGRPVSLGMLRADRSGAPRVQADILRLPVPDGSVDGVTCGFALRNLVDLPAFFAELARVVRPGGRIALLDVGVPRNRLVRAGHGIYFGKVVPRDRRAAVRPGRLPLPAPQRRLPAAAGRDGRAASRAGFADADPPSCSRSASPSCSPARGAHPDRPDARRHPSRRRRDPALDLNDVARGDGFLFVRDGVGFAGRGVAARVPVDDVRGGARRDRARRRDGLRRRARGVGPVAFGWVPFAPGGAGELVVPAVVVGKGADGSRWVTVDRRRRRDAGAAVRAAGRRPTRYTIEPVTPVDRYLAAVAAARDAARAGRIVKAVIAREIRVVAAHPIDRHAVLHRLKAAFGSSYRFSVDGFIGASPELLVGRRRAHRAVAPAGRHRAAHRRSRRATPSSPPSSSPAPRTRSSTAS